MPLESGTYISDLVSTNPAHTDSVGQADSHMRFIKSALLATFTGITGAVTATHTALNAAVAAVVAGTAPAIHALGTALLPSLTFLGNLNTGIYSPAANKVAVTTNGTQAALFGSDQSLTVAGAYAGGTGQLLPVGLPLPWLSNTLPSANFAWLNGQAISRAGFPLLFAMWGTFYGVGNGTTTFNVPNLQEVVLIGRATMGGAADPGLVSNAGISTLGTIVGEGKHTLLQAELPAVAPTFTGSVASLSQPVVESVTTGSVQPGVGSTVLNGSTSGTPTVTAAGTISNLGSGIAHNVVQPSIACNWICLLG